MVDAVAVDTVVVVVIAEVVVVDRVMVKSDLQRFYQPEKRTTNSSKHKH